MRYLFCIFAWWFTLSGVVMGSTVPPHFFNTVDKTVIMNTQEIREYEKQGLTKGQYYTIHHWLLKNYGQADKCENTDCTNVNAKRFDHALKDGCLYEKNINNYIKLCRSCHMKYDMTDESRKKKSLAGKKGTKKVINSAGFIFNSVTEAHRKTGISHTSIQNNLANRSFSAGGLNWEYLI